MRLFPSFLLFLLLSVLPLCFCSPVPPKSYHLPKVIKDSGVIINPVTSLPGWNGAHLLEEQYTGYLPTDDGFDSKLFFWVRHTKHTTNTIV